MSIIILFKFRRFAPIVLHALALASLFASQYTNLCLTALAGGSVLRRVFDPGSITANPKNSKQRSNRRTRAPSKLLKGGIHYLALILFVIFLARNGLAVIDNKLPRTSTVHIVGLDICMGILLYQRLWCMGPWAFKGVTVNASRKIENGIVVGSPKGKHIASYRVIAPAKGFINTTRPSYPAVNRLSQTAATGSVAFNSGPASNVTSAVEGLTPPGLVSEPVKSPSIRPSLGTNLPDYDPRVLARMLKKAQARAFVAGEAFETVPSIPTASLKDTTQVFIDVPLQSSVIAASAPVSLVYKGRDFVPCSGLISVPPLASTVELPIPPVNSSKLVFKGYEFVPAQASSIQVPISSVKVSTPPAKPSSLVFKDYEFAPAQASSIQVVIPPVKVSTPPVKPSSLVFKGYEFVPAQEFMHTSPQILDTSLHS